MEVAKRRGGTYCTYKDCKNTYYNKKTPDSKFFRFPKNPQLCEEWLKCCGRQDLIPKINVVNFYNCHVCSLHFDPIMYIGPAENRLLPLATPILYKHESTEQPQTIDVAVVPDLQQPSTAERTSDQLKNMTICERHFSERSFVNAYRNRLIKSAIPNTYFSESIETRKSEAIHEETKIFVGSMKVNNCFVF